MWWQLGVTHFAPPGADTSRYMGVMVFLDGTLRLLASAAGMTLVFYGVPPATLIIIGCIVIVYGHTLVRRIKTITDVANRISVGELDAEMSIRSNDELGRLADAIAAELAASDAAPAAEAASHRARIL